MGGAHQFPFAQQQCGQSLIQLMERNGLDQAHQLGQALREQAEHIVAERLVLGQQPVEQRRRQGEQGDRSFGNAGG